MTSLRNVFLALILLAAAAASWYFGAPTSQRDARLRSEDAASLGYYLKDAVFRGMNAEGRPLYEISATHIEENADSDDLILQNVEITYFETEDIPWLARAATATAPRNRAFVDLQGSVRLFTAEDAEGRRTLIETEAMRLEPERYFATTDGPVRFAVGDQWMTASKLEADLKDDVIRGANVHAKVVR